MRKTRWGHILTVVLCLLVVMPLLVLPPVGGGQEEATPLPMSSPEWKTYVNREWGYSVSYPKDWNVRVTFTNSLYAPAHIIRQRVTFLGPNDAEVNIDVWQKEAKLGLMEWIVQYQRRFLQLGGGRYTT